MSFSLTVNPTVEVDLTLKQRVITDNDFEKDSTLTLFLSHEDSAREVQRFVQGWRDHCIVRARALANGFFLHNMSERQLPRTSSTVQCSDIVAGNLVYSERLLTTSEPKLAVEAYRSAQICVIIFSFRSKKSFHYAAEIIRDLTSQRDRKSSLVLIGTHSLSTHAQLARSNVDALLKLAPQICYCEVHKVLDALDLLSTVRDTVRAKERTPLANSPVKDVIVSGLRYFDSGIKSMSVNMSL